MKGRKQTTAGMILLCKENECLKEMLKTDEPKVLVTGRKRFCRIWREKTDTSLCDQCCTVGHTFPECKGKPVCRSCRKEHLSTEHKCPIVDCPAPKGVACMHCRRMCNLCESDAHYTGFRSVLCYEKDRHYRTMGRQHQWRVTIFLPTGLTIEV